MAVSMDTIDAIQRRAVNNATRSFYDGGYLSSEEVEDVGEEGLHWLCQRFGLERELDEEGGVNLTPAW